MPSYRRNYHGDLFFFTLVTADRKPIFASAANRRRLSSAMRRTRIDRPWETVAIVLMPDHLHMLWRMPNGDRDYSGRISSIKRRFTRAYLAGGGREADVPRGQQRHRRRGVWQRKFWEHTIRDARDYHRHMDYIHMNPVKHGLVQRARDWPASSFHRYVKAGWYEPDWAGRMDLPGSVEYFIPE
ncbi:MAG: REP-associated tyrosine transposase [Planctomycetota bacterium]